LGVVIEEADEVGFWLQLLIDTAVLPGERLQPLIDEADQLVAIFIRSSQTARKKQSAPLS